MTLHSCHLPHRLFIATPLLPCGDLDAKIQKFTGNNEFGDVNVKDHLMKAIHAFTHFTAVYMQETIVFCDLQGKYSVQIVHLNSHSFSLLFYSRYLQPKQYYVFNQPTRTYVCDSLSTCPYLLIATGAYRATQENNSGYKYWDGGIKNLSNSCRSTKKLAKTIGFVWHLIWLMLLSKKNLLKLWMAQGRGSGVISHSL